MARATPLVYKKFWYRTSLFEVPPDQTPHMQSATKLYPLGTRLQLGERVWYYAKAGSTALAAGKMCMNNTGPASDHINMAVASAAAAGATDITITNGSTTAITANMFADGYVSVNDVDGEGHDYTIKEHAAAATSASCKLYLNEEVIVALTTNSQVTLHKNLFDGCAISAVEENIPAGVPPIAVTASYYFWIQTWGPRSTWQSDTSARGYLMKPAGTAGKIAAVTATNDSDPDFPAIGWNMVAGVDTEYRLAYLRLHP